MIMTPYPDQHCTFPIIKYFHFRHQYFVLCPGPPCTPFCWYQDRFLHACLCSLSSSICSKNSRSYCGKAARYTASFGLCGVVVHVDLLDPEDGILRRRAGAPALVSVGPVVEDPRSGHVGHALLGLPGLDAVDKEADNAGKPVDAVLMFGRRRVRRRRYGLEGLWGLAAGGLVREPDLAFTGVALGCCV